MFGIHLPFETKHHFSYLLIFWNSLFVGGGEPGWLPEPILKAYMIFCLLTCDMFDLVIIYSAAPLRVWFILNLYPTLDWVHWISILSSVFIYIYIWSIPSLSGEGRVWCERMHRLRCHAHTTHQSEVAARRFVDGVAAALVAAAAAAASAYGCLQTASV